MYKRLVLSFLSIQIKTSAPLSYCMYKRVVLRGGTDLVSVYQQNGQRKRALLDCITMHESVFYCRLCLKFSSISITGICMNRSNRENVPGKGAMYQFVTPPVKRLAPRAEQIGFTSTKQDKLDAADPALGHPFIFFSICP